MYLPVIEKEVENKENKKLKKRKNCFYITFVVWTICTMCRVDYRQSNFLHWQPLLQCKTALVYTLQASTDTSLLVSQTLYGEFIKVWVVLQMENWIKIRDEKSCFWHIKYFNNKSNFDCIKYPVQYNTNGKVAFFLRKKRVF